MDYFKRHTAIISIVFLIIICSVMYLLNIGNYPLIDVNETKYVSIARDMIYSKDWGNIKLNGENFFDCPPLIFWIINTSFLIFGKISTFTARFPFSLTALIGIIILYSSVAKILTKSFAFITSLIAATSLGFLVFSHIATTDIIYTVTTMTAILCTYLMILGDHSTKKEILWFLVYLFMSLSLLTGGLFGIAIPFISIILIYVFSGKLKDVFKLSNIITGLIIILTIATPWFIIMLQEYGINFLKGAISPYNISKCIGIKQCFSVISLFLIGFLPWTFSLIWVLGSRINEIRNSIVLYFKDNSQAKLNEKWKLLSKTDKFLSVNTIVLFTSLIFAISFGSKNTYLILFLIFPSSCIAGYYWYNYLFREKHDKSIFFATLIPNLLYIISSLVAVLGYNFIDILTRQGFDYLIIPLGIILFVIPLLGIFAVILKWRKSTFIANIILMISLSFVLTPGIFMFIVTNGGEELIKFAQIANNESKELTAYIPSKKYSLIYYYEGKINFHNKNEINWLKEYMQNNPERYIITEIKTLWEIEENKINYSLINSGKRYCLIKPSQKIKKKNKEQEPKIIVY